MTCKFCLEDKKCIEAHIIPNSLYKPIFNQKSGMLLLSNKSKNYPKKQHTGIYDPNILCEDCERLFSKPDNYAKSFFSADIPEESFIILDGRKVAYTIKDFDYHNLKLFFISLLWRASVSTQPFFFDVKIGPFENQIKEMMKKSDPGDENTFSVTITRYDDSLAKRMKLSPNKGKWDSINYYTFYFRGWKSFIKVDKRHPPEIMSDFMMRPNQPLIVFYLPFRKSTEIVDMKEMARLYKRRITK